MRRVSVINLAATENTGDTNTATGKFHCTMTNRHTLCLSAKKYWNTKEDKGKSMMYVLYILWLTKGTSWDKVTLNTPCSQEIKTVASSIVEICLAGSISLLVTQSA